MIDPHGTAVTGLCQFFNVIGRINHGSCCNFLDLRDAWDTTEALVRRRPAERKGLRRDAASGERD